MVINSNDTSWISFVFQSFIRKINKSNSTVAQIDKDQLKNEEGTELRPIVR